MPADTLTVRQVAERYGVGEHTVLRWIRSGELRAVNVARKLAARRPTWRIPAGAIAAFEAVRAPSPRVERTRRRAPVRDVIAFY